MIWSRFSRNVLKISRTSRSCFPMPMILVLTSAEFVAALDRRFEVEFAGGDAVQLGRNAVDGRERDAG